MPKPVCPNLATATPSARRGTGATARRVARDGRAAIRHQTVLQGRGTQISLPWFGELTFRTPTRHRAPNREPGRVSDPRRRSSRGSWGPQVGHAARQWRRPDAACPVSTASWCNGPQAQMPPCNRQAISTSIHIAEIRARRALLAVIHCYIRTYCLWREQFQIDAPMVVKPSSGRGIRLDLMSAVAGQDREGPLLAEGRLL